MKKIIFLIFICSQSLFAQWIQLNSPTTQALEKTKFINQYTGWFCGEGGVIYKTTNGGSNWISQQSGTTGTIKSIFFINENTGWAVGDAGFYVKTTNGGLNWNQQSIGTTTTLFDVQFLDTNNGYIAGGGIFKTSNGGTSWIATSASGGLYSCFFINVNTGWSVGLSTCIIKTSNAGTNWYAQSSPVSTYLFYPVFFINENTGWTGGNEGQIIKTTNGGNNWFQQNYTHNTPIRSIFFIDQNTGYLCGYNSNSFISKTRNSGNNWTDQVSNKSFASISFINAKTGWVVGNSGILKTVTGGDSVKAVLSNIYKPNCGRIQNELITLSDSLCLGADSSYWYVNDSLVGKNHIMSYIYKQGTTITKLIIKNNQTGDFDSTTSTVTRCAWKRYTNGQIFAGLSLISDSILYAVSTGDKVYRMDINGNPLLTIQVNGNILSSCSIGYDTTIFIGSSDNNLYGFNRWGFPLWPAFALGGAISSTPTIDSLSNKIYAGVENGNFAAVNKSSGTIGWGIQLGSPIKSSAVISYDRKLVCVSATGIIYGFNLNIPTPLPPNWALNLNDSILVSPAIDTSGYFYFGSRGGKVYKIALTGTSTATIVWQTALASAVTSSPTIDANGNIYVGTADGKFYSLNKSGGIRWFFQSPAQIKSTAAITAYQRIYFGNDAGEIYGLDTNKNIKFYYIDSAKISCSMLHHKGTLYFGNEAGRLFALYDSTGGSKGPWTPIWGTFQNNPRRTGDQSNRIPVPLTPVLLSPPNGFSGLSLTPLLDWDDTPFAQKFRVQLATDSLFSGIVYDTSNVYVSLLTVPAGKLNFNTKYFWRVNGQNATGISQWSGAWWFTTALAVPPPVLISPLNSAIGVSLTPSLIWSSITMATSYRFQISTNSGFTSIILDSTVYSTAVNIPAGKLGSITQYYWRVASISTAGQGSFCSPWSFTTRNNLILNLKTYLEGFWNGSSMIPDTANIYIANASSPFGFLDSAVIVFSTSATATAIFSLPPNGNYYVAIKHRNHLETWSRLSQSFVTNIAVNYDFTTDSAKAYGFNMKKVGSDWVLIVGDANQDGSIDAVDVSDLIIQYGNIGYLSCDFNGDGSVDAADVPYMIENYGLTKVVPTLISEPVKTKKQIQPNIKKETKQKKNNLQKEN